LNVIFKTQRINPKRLPTEKHKMKTAENLLRLLGVQNYTQRHIQIINDFIKSGDEDVKKLLDQLGGWDSNDLKQAELWMES